MDRAGRSECANFRLLLNLCSASSGGFCAGASAAILPPEKLLPKDTAMLVTMPDSVNGVASFDQFPLRPIMAGSGGQEFQGQIHWQVFQRRHHPAGTEPGRAIVGLQRAGPGPGHVRPAARWRSRTSPARISPGYFSLTQKAAPPSSAAIWLTSAKNGPPRASP